MNCGHCLFAIAQEHTTQNAGTDPAPTEEPTMSPEEWQAKWQAKLQTDIIALLDEAKLAPLFAVEAAVREAFNPDNEDTPILASNAEIDAVVKAVTDRLKQQMEPPTDANPG